LKPVLLNSASNTALLSRLSCVSKGVRETAAEVVRLDLKTLLPAAVVKHGWLCDVNEVEWLCKTAGPAVLGSPDMAQAVLLELDHIHADVAAILADNGEHIQSVLWRMHACVRACTCESGPVPVCPPMRVSALV
jgi:hypothetical protein